MRPSMIRIPPQEIRTERKSDHDFDKLNDQFSSAHRCNGGSYLGPTETMILLSEFPRIPFNVPDTWIVKKSCPTKSELAVYENPGPSNFTWPDCGGEMSLAVSIVKLHEHGEDHGCNSARYWSAWSNQRYPISTDIENPSLRRTRLQVLVEQAAGVQASLRL